MTEPMDMASTFVVVDKALRAEAVAVTDALWAELDERFGDFAGRSLISSLAFDDNWPTWEVHPYGE